MEHQLAFHKYDNKTKFIDAIRSDRRKEIINCLLDKFRREMDSDSETVFLN